MPLRLILRNTRLLTEFLWGSTLILMMVAAPLCWADTPPPPPAEYQDLYDTLSADLDAFNATLNGLWTGSTYPVVFGGNLANVNSNGGPLLATSGGGSLQLQELQALGIKAVVIQVCFPVFYPPFYDYLVTQPGFENVTYDQFVTFYSQVAQNVRAAGLKLIVENNVLLSNDVAAGWNPAISQYYATLDWPTFEAARAQDALNVAQTLQPDYLIVLEEPFAQAAQTGQANINTVSGAADLVNQILTALAPLRGNAMLVGAGMANDQPNVASFAQSFVGINCSDSQPCVNPPGLDFLDMHIYPVNNLSPNQNFLQNALTVASTAASAGKPVSMTEAWMWKMRDAEWGVLPVDDIRARNPFSFWAPLDWYFLQTLENFANYTQMLFMAPEGPQFLWAYLTYDSSFDILPPSQILSQEATAASNANLMAAYTSTGLSYYASLVVPPDKTPPSDISILTSGSGSSGSASLSWTPSTDDVGVPGYHMWRNGTPLPDTALTMFQDSGLTGNTTYTYQIEAFDLGGNVSTPVSVSITTQNSGAPNPPTNLVAVGVLPEEVTLTWTPPANCNFNSYLLFRGTSPDNMVQVQQLYDTDTTFSQGGLTPNTTYYYGLESKANGGLTSVMSNIAVVTTP